MSTGGIDKSSGPFSFLKKQLNKLSEKKIFKGRTYSKLKEKKLSGLFKKNKVSEDTKKLSKGRVDKSRTSPDLEEIFQMMQKRQTEKDHTLEDFQQAIIKEYGTEEGVSKSQPEPSPKVKKNWESFKGKLEDLQSFKSGAKYLEGTTPHAQDQNHEKFKSDLRQGMNKSFGKPIENGPFTTRNEKDKSIFTQAPRWENAEPTKSFKIGRCKITKKMQLEQKEGTKIRVIKDRIKGDEVKKATKEGVGALEDQENKMLYRCVSSPMWLVADAHLNKLEKPVRANAYVMSARNYAKQTDKTFSGDEVAMQTAFFAKAAIEDKCDMIVDTGIGMGAFLAGTDEQKTEAREKFAKNWVEQMAANMKNNNVRVCFAAGNRELRDLVQKEIDNLEDENIKDRFVVTEKMGPDVARLAGENGFNVAVRIAGDPSGVIGQHSIDNTPTHHIAQEELFGFGSTLNMTNVFVEGAEVTEVDESTLTTR